MYENPGDREPLLPMPMCSSSLFDFKFSLFTFFVEEISVGTSRDLFCYIPI